MDLEGGLSNLQFGFKVLGGCVDRRRIDGWMGGDGVVARQRVLQLLPHVIVGSRCPPLQRHKTDLGRALQSGESSQRLSAEQGDRADSIQHLLSGILAQPQSSPNHPPTNPPRGLARALLNQNVLREG